ncbi:MAG: murein biosynthesis integral membrane protein MurJ [Elusimicrobiales bacterium]|nr:murein biosynthesis integral membrane protein MurJ [Elusimicrobiales bacterium]
MSTHRKIARAYTILVAASIAGHALSMVKEIIAANAFGVSKAMDAFYAALTFPNLLNSIFLAPFSIIFIPILIRYKTKSLPEANRIISTVSNIIYLVLGAAAAVSFTFAGRIVNLASPGLDIPTGIAAENMLRILSAGIIFTGAVNILTGILNAFEHFLWPAFSGMFVTLCTICLLLFFTDTLGVYALGWGLLAGTVLQFLFLAPIARRYGYSHSAALDLDHPAIRLALDSAFIFLIINVLSGFNTVINRYMASWLPAGSIAGLAYADKLVQVPLVIFSGAIASSIYPFLSAQAAENKLDEMRDTVSLSLRMSGFIFIPLAITMMILAEPAIRLLFQRGAFDLAATRLTSQIFVYSCLLLFSNYAVAILMRLMFAFQDFRNILKVVGAGLVLNAGLNYVFIRVMDPPACGVALSAAVGSFVMAVLFFLILKKRVSNLHGLAILKALSRIAAFAAVSGFAVFFSYQYLSARLHTTLVNQAAALAGAAAAGLLVFVLISAAFRLEEFLKVYQHAVSKLRRKRERPA